MEASERTDQSDADEQRLAELGYKQELPRGWTRFTNFAISFSIISVLAGCFTTYYVAWNNGGPIDDLDRMAGPCADHPHGRRQHVRARLGLPDRRRPYWWAHRLGGAGWSWFTGWFNVLGLIGIVASVDYVAAFFWTQLFGLWGWDLGFVNFADKEHIIPEIFWVFAIILALHALINIYSSHLVALFNSISVWWHVVGVLIIIGILVFVPDNHQSADFVFTERINNSGFDGGSTTSFTYWFLVLPVGFLLTMYTITGYDASAHVAEETVGAEQSAAKGIWQSVASSALIGWFVLLAITFAATDVDAVNEGFGSLARGLHLRRHGPELGRGDHPDRRASASSSAAWPASRACRGRSSRSRATARFPAGSCGAGSAASAACRWRPWPRSCFLVFLLMVPALPGQGTFVPPVAVLRGHRDRDDRALHRLRGAGISALARRRFVRDALVDAWAAVQVDQPDRGPLRHLHVHRPLPARLQHRRAVGVRLRLELLQLHAARRRPRPARHRAGLGAGRQQALQGPDQADRVRRGDGHQGGSDCRTGARRERPGRKTRISKPRSSAPESSAPRPRSRCRAAASRWRCSRPSPSRDWPRAAPTRGSSTRASTRAG